MNHRLKPWARGGFALLLGLCWSAFSASAAAQALSAQDKLAAIRHELVQAALEAPTHVQVTQWIDGQGVLRESSSFRSGMKIRGVRVLSYVQNTQGEPGAKVDWQTSTPFNAAVATAQAGPGQASKNCKRAESGHLAHIAALAWTFGPHWNADDLPLLLEFKALFRSDWDRSGPNNVQWRLAEPKTDVQRSSYHQALLASGADDIPWKIDLSVTQVPTPRLALPFETLQKMTGANLHLALVSSPPLRLQLQMTLSSRLQNRPVLQLSAPIELEAQINNLEAVRLNPASRQRVFQQAQSWAQEIQAVLTCLPVVAQVTQATPSGLRINVGAAAGVRMGDEWLLGDRQTIPQRLLEADIASNIVLAKVQLIDQHHALLQVQAGATSNVQRNWIAWAVEKPIEPTRTAP
jgi:hypothetical protein